MSRPLLGVIGGMGTQATACFYEKLHKMQNVTAEQDFLDVLLFSKPSIPDRTAFITGQSEDNPLDSIVSAARLLEAAGVSFIAIPCVTSHYFYDSIASSVSVPIVNLPDGIAAVAMSRNVRNACLLATDGTIKGKVCDSAFEKRGINLVLPPDEIQADLMTLIYNIKCGTEASGISLDEIVARVLQNGTDAVILGCTELCIASVQNENTIDVLDVLAESVLRMVHDI